MEVLEHEYFKKKCLSDFDKMIHEPLSLKLLTDFHARNKYLYFCYSQKYKNILGGIVANHEKKDLPSLFEEYRENLEKLLADFPSRANVVNAYLHIFGYFKKELSKEEKDNFLAILNDYQRNRIDGVAVGKMLGDYAMKYERQYILEQTILEPYLQNVQSFEDLYRGKEEDFL